VTGDPIARLRAADPLEGELPPPLEQMPARPAAEPVRGRGRGRALTFANMVLLATVLFHVADHGLIQERGVGALSFEVVLGGMVITATATASLLVALRGDRRAPLVALLSGTWVATTVALGHFTGSWAGEFSDSYGEAGLGAISYVAALSVVAAGVALGGYAARQCALAWRSS
jgi:hypothetical protein